jgi:hypothetical protein
MSYFLAEINAMSVKMGTAYALGYDIFTEFPALLIETMWY